MAPLRLIVVRTTQPAACLPACLSVCVSVCPCRRTDRTYEELAAAVRGGAIGAVRSVHAIFRDHPVPPIEFLKKVRCVCPRPPPPQLRPSLPPSLLPARSVLASEKQTRSPSHLTLVACMSAAAAAATGPCCRVHRTFILHMFLRSIDSVRFDLRRTPPHLSRTDNTSNQATHRDALQGCG